MSKRKKDDAVELETATDAQDAAGSAEAVDAGADGEGQAVKAVAKDAPAGDEIAADAAAAGEVPGAADADAHAADGEEPEAAGKEEEVADHRQVAAPGNRMDINVLAAYSAASLAFGTTEDDTTTLPRFDVAWLGQRGDRAQAAALCAAGFLRRDAAVLVQPETLVIHLKRNGFPDAVAAVGRAAVAWKVFAFALAELDALDRAEADARRRAEQAAEAGQGPRPVRRLGMALQRRDANPLTELGRRLQRSESAGKA